MGPGCRGRNRLRQDGRRGTLCRPVPRGLCRRGPEVLHREVRRPRVRGEPARAAGQRQRALSRRGHRVGEEGARAGGRRPCGGRPGRARRPARRPRTGDRDPARGAQGRAGPACRRVAGLEGGHRHRGREARRGHRLAQRRQPAARAAGRVEGAAPHRPQLRRRALAPVLHRPDRLHPSPQVPLRRAAREARCRPGGQGTARHGGRGTGRLHRLGSDGRPVPRPDEAVEGRRACPARRRRRAVEAIPRRPGHLLRRARRRHGRAGQGVRRQRRGQGAAPGRGRGVGPRRRPRGRQAHDARHRRALGGRRQGPP